MQYETRCAHFFQLDHVDADLDAGALAQCARLEVLLEHLYRWLAKNGIISRNGQMRPCVRLLIKLETQLSNAYSKCGLNPTSRRQHGMGGQRSGIAWELSDEDEVEDVEETQDTADDGGVNDAE